MTIIPPIHVRIISPREVILDTDAQSVSSSNIQGKFDILPLHINFITLIENKPLVIRIRAQKPLVFNFPIAIIVALENKVDIYTYALNNQQPPRR